MAEDNGAGGYSAGEMIAGGLLLLLAIGLLLVGADMATGGRITRVGKRGCGCGEADSDDS